MPCHPTEIFSLFGEVAAANFTAPPALTLVSGLNAFQDFQVEYELMGLSLASSLTNFGTANMGVFLLLGQNQPVIAYNKSTPSLISSVTGQNSLVGPPAVGIPSDKSITRVFLQPVIVRPNMRIALYAFGDTTAGNALAAYVSLDMRKRG